ncbi:hypothetical protein PYH37_006259 (plasmid) [Sinorhizobium numidicum]|uniref:Uncharacterized protein n=1 Tax=Sinorhizobium numidicum TaxID=680248 RepID=A0ABY8D5R1_9HYPH|nr:hypothetical protein [Sinorhizobium numidicum]WEX79371.1 hypothetical protein PYH37_006259 [Sinorhizobium numidicum]WEX85672.1 hypothetical protein PYH38_006125 [Sinorhizobium numidicum]
MPKINAERLLSDLRHLAQFGAYRTGVHRPTYSKEDMDSRRWLAQQYEAVGLKAHIDGSETCLVCRGQSGDRC